MVCKHKVIMTLYQINERGVFYGRVEQSILREIEGNFPEVFGVGRQESGT